MWLCLYKIPYQQDIELCHFDIYVYLLVFVSALLLDVLQMVQILIHKLKLGPKKKVLSLHQIVSKITNKFHINLTAFIAKSMLFYFTSDCNTKSLNSTCRNCASGTGTFRVAASISCIVGVLMAGVVRN